ncbi:MAG TPA: type II secretion system protein GspD [Chromatiaceae bacterium]|nr:type II secretion system protein GspD [Chromatiaceae bacterium]
MEKSGMRQTGTNVFRSPQRRLLGLWSTLVIGLMLSLSAQAQNLTLNLKDADINALIGTISEVTGTNFIVDPRVKGKVTVISSKPMPAEEAYQVFLSILKVHGFAAIPFGSIVKIVPDVSAKQDAIPTVDSRAPGKGDEIVTRIVQVDNVSAAQLVPILRPMVPQQGHLAAYPDSNVLIISDRAANIDRLVGIIHSIDKAGDNEIEVIALQYASASEMVRILSTLYKRGSGKGPLSASKVTLAADERTNSVILAGERGTRMQMRATIAQLDTEPEETGNTHVIYLSYAKAEDLAPVLTGLGKTKQADNSQKKGVAATRAKAGFDIQADPSTNALVITAPPDIFRSLRSVIRKLDIRRAQVHIEAIIVEVSPEQTKELGIQWLGASNNAGIVGGSVFNNGGSSILSAATSPLSAAGTGLSLGFFDGVVDIPGVDDTVLSMHTLINALDRNVDNNILATPSIVTLDNEEAQIVVAENVPFRTGNFTTSSSGASNPFETIERQDVGLILKVTPQINEGSAIQLKISQEASSVKTATTSDTDLTTEKRTIDTTVLIDNEQVLVLGGLIRTTVQENIQKVPFLGDIPLFGKLFQSRATTLKKTNLMVFIKATILRDYYDTHMITSNKYRHIRAIQLQRQNEGISLFPNEPAPTLEPMQDVPAPSEPQADAMESMNDGV